MKKEFYEKCPYCGGKKCYRIRDKKINGYRVFCGRLNKISEEVVGKFNKITL